MNWTMSKSFINYSHLSLIVCSLAFIACSRQSKQETRVEALPFYEEASFTPNWILESDVPQDFHRIPSFTLVNQSGDSVTEEKLNGKVTVVDFFFTSCPGICPKMTKNMKLVQEAFKDKANAQIFSHSVTPEYDSIPILQAYAQEKGINENKWQLLTGDRSVIYDLGRNHYFIEEDLGLEKDPEDFIHTENFILLDQKRRIRGIYNGLNKASIRQLIADATALLEDV